MNRGKFEKMGTSATSPAIHTSAKYNKISKKKFIENATSDDSKGQSLYTKPQDLNSISSKNFVSKSVNMNKNKPFYD